MKELPLQQRGHHDERPAAIHKHFPSRFVEPPDNHRVRLRLATDGRSWRKNTVICKFDDHFRIRDMHVDGERLRRKKKVLHDFRRQETEQLRRGGGNDLESRRASAFEMSLGIVHFQLPFTDSVQQSDAVAVLARITQITQNHFCILTKNEPLF